jgi:hypothetical protein
MVRLAILVLWSCNTPRVAGEEISGYARESVKLDRPGLRHIDGPICFEGHPFDFFDHLGRYR